MNLEAVQETLENEMVSAGVKRYNEQVERGLSTVTPGKALIRRGMRKLVPALEEYAEGKQSGPRPAVDVRALLRDLDLNIVADLVLRRALDGALREDALIKVAKAIAKAIEWHERDRSLNEASVAIWNKTQERLSKTQDPEFRRKSIDGTVAGIRRWAEENAPDLAENLESVKGVEWDIEAQVAVGCKLLDVLAQSTGLIESDVERRSRNQSRAFVRLTPATREWVDDKNAKHELLRPVFRPMVVPPTDWTGVKHGGYRDNSKAGVEFIKTRARTLELENCDLTDLFDAVNLIQRTPWRVNLSVLRVMSQAWSTGSRLGDIPPKHPEDAEMPLVPLPSKYVHMTPEERGKCKDPELAAWRFNRKRAHEFNTDLRSDSADFGVLINMATEYAQYPAFYHPHKLDWRQRAYPISVFLSPQGDQFNKALIEFADGKRMGDSENSAAWLAIHGANCFGVDKVSFDERIAWVEEHVGEILESAFDPFGCKFWQAADKPWPFLAFCFEWVGYLIAGDDHITHLPVALDGSNSGLQHLSAMLKDENGARITCVKPGDQPEDVYQMVADEVENILAEKISEDSPWPGIWQGKVVRKICKQPTMTYTYSATETGMKNQIVSALKDLDSKSETGSHLSFTDRHQTNRDAAAWLAPIVRSAIAAQMSKAAEAMEFMQQLARVYSQTGLPLRWTTPLNMPVVQYYPQTTSKLRKVFINGQMHRLRLNIDAPDRLDKKRTSAGVSPNFVHSMDSTHLLWTVLGCNDEYGIEHFAMIHDSFGTHATMCDELASMTREQFINLYDWNRTGYGGGRLADLFYETIENLGTAGFTHLIDELPGLPEFGQFDIQSVRDADYFFA